MKETWKQLMQQPLEDALYRETPHGTDVQQRIVAAALELFAEKGYDGTTTQTIAQRAGVSEKTLFKHFRSKENLFIKTVYPSLLQLIRPFVFDELKKLISSIQPNLQESLTAVARDRLKFALEQTDVLKLIVQELLLRPEFRESFIEMWKNQLLPNSLELLHQMKDKGELRDLPVRSILRVFISCIAGYALTRTVLAPDENWDDDVELRVTIDILLNGLKPGH
jgi:AcrR family transcriptional regulator